MHDLNFFAHYKRSKTKNKAFLVFLLLLLTVIVLVNVVLIGGGLYRFNMIRTDIRNMRDFINNPVTQKSLDEAAAIKAEADLTAKYRGHLEEIDAKLDQLDQIDSQLFSWISELTPVKVSLNSVQIDGINIQLTCVAQDATAPMDMYHALNLSPHFTAVRMDGIVISETGSSFSISFVIQEEGGDRS